MRAVATNAEAAALAAATGSGANAAKAKVLPGTCETAPNSKGAASIARRACLALSALAAWVSSAFDSTLGFPGEGPSSAPQEPTQPAVAPADYAAGCMEAATLEHLAQEAEVEFLGGAGMHSLSTEEMWTVFCCDGDNFQIVLPDHACVTNVKQAISELCEVSRFAMEIYVKGREEPVAEETRLSAIGHAPMFMLPHSDFTQAGAGGTVQELWWANLEPTGQLDARGLRISGTRGVAGRHNVVEQSCGAQSGQ